MTNQRDDELLRNQPHGRRGRGGRLIGAGRAGRYGNAGPGGNAGLARQLRIAQRRPQAILKITRYGHGGNKILGHIHYVRRHGRLALENEVGEKIQDVRELRELVRHWTQQAGAGMDEPGAEVKRKRRVTAHFILDAGSEAKPEVLTAAARQFLSERFGEKGHEYLFARHDDTKQPHVHVVLNLMDGQGRRLHTSVQEVQSWREQFAATARKHGIEVDASRAWERGKAPARSRDLMRYGAPKPARWTREQVRQGLAARKHRLLSDAALAAARGDRTRAESLRTKAATLRMRTDDKSVRRVVAEKRSPAPSKPWEVARARNTDRLATAFRRHAADVELEAEATTDDTRKILLQRAADRLRAFAGKVRPTPTRAQEIAVELQGQREQDAGVERDQ